jgi:4-hydroxy-tetrahydrodipicolinate synthase
MRKITGVIPPIVTPFDNQSKVDEGTLRKLTRYLLDANVHALVSCGSTGEFAMMTLAERKRVTEVVNDEVGGKIPLVEGVTAVGVREALELTEHAKQLGLDAVLAAPSYYYKLQENELEEYFGKIAKVDIPIILYNNPSTTKTDMSPELITKLAMEYDNIQYVKESTGDISRVNEIRHLGNRIEVICGWDTLIYDFLCHGVKVWIATVSNVIPRECVKLVDLSSNQQNISEARDLFHSLFPIIKVIDSPKFVQATKTALNLLGHPCGRPRSPLLPLNEKESKDIKDALATLRNQPPLNSPVLAS